MKKICFFANSMFKLGGEQRITTQIVNGLVNKGFDVTILIKYKEKINLKLFDLSEKVHIEFLDVNYDFRLNNTYFFDNLRSLNRKTGIFQFFPHIIRHFFCSNKLLKQLKIFFKNNHFDYVVGVAGDRSFILSYLKPSIKGKLIFWNHQSVDAHFKNKNARYYREVSFIKPLFKNFDEIIVLTYFDKEKMDKYYNLDCRVIKNCKSFEAKRKSTLNHNRFLAVGRLVPQKGYDYLLAAMALFIKNNTMWKLDIYGEGEDYQLLLKLIREYHLEKYVNICSSNENMENIYLEHDIYLMSSRYEGFGLVTLEAMECGLPIIAFNIPANKELIVNGKNGFLVPCYDINKFAKEMEKLANNDKLRKEIASNLKQSIEEFSYDKIINQWVNLLEDLS